MKNKDFQIIYKEGKSYANKYLVMYIRENNTDQNRLGRLIRESYRLQEEHFKRGLDIIVIARNSAKGKTYHDIESALLHLGSLHEIIE